VLVHQGGRGQSYVYELLLAPGDGGDAPLLPGLIDVERLKMTTYDRKRSGQKGPRSGLKAEKAPPGRPLVGGVSGGGRGGLSASNEKDLRRKAAKTPKNAHLEHQETGPSYVEGRRRRGVAQEVS